MDENFQNKPNLEILSTPEEVAQKTVDIFVSDAKKAIGGRGVFTVAIPGGQTPKRFFEMLTESIQAKMLPWEKIHIFWADERFVPADSPRSNYKLASDIFLTKVGIPTQNIHPVPVDTKDPETSAKFYEEEVRKFFGISKNKLPIFDLIILGLGADGHIASLFPYNCDLLGSNDISAVADKNGEKRITLTAATIKAARQIILLICGPEKAEILKEVLENEYDEVKYPVHQLLDVSERAAWLADADAAKLL